MPTFKPVKKAPLVLLTFAVLTGCIKLPDARAPASPQSPSGSDERTAIGITTVLYGDAPDFSSPYYRELQHRMGVSLAIRAIPYNSYHDQFRLDVTSQKLTDVVLNLDPYSSISLGAIRQGAFHDLTPFLGDARKYPNLARIPKTVWNNTKIGGKLYGIPRPTGLTDLALHIRKDWLDKLGLPVPATLDEYTAALRAFARLDPDGNRKRDTYGLAVYGPTLNAAAGPLGSAFGANTPTFEGDHLLIPFMTSGYRDMVAWFRDLYAEGVIPPMYMLQLYGQERDLAKNGKAGSLGNPLNGLWEIQMTAQSQDPQAEWITLPPLRGPGGYSSFQPPGYIGVLMIASHVPKEKVERIISFLDQTATQSFKDFERYGLEGRHHVADNGTIQIHETLRKQEIGDITIGVGYYEPHAKAVTPKAPSAFNERQIRLSEQYAEVGVPTPLQSLVSDTYTSRSADLFKDKNMLLTKVITGESPLQEWDDYVSRIKADPDVRKMMREYAEQFRMHHAETVLWGQTTSR
ncbi:extracellular solute-binding protein [Paenibacillus mesophilus]|uniref:extracellular solute-binding protein n=1 Tax=Paenibacillus mesophilus TaxID=2582849 RepID=UPI00110DAA67|nr:extracellular solute-binding protein [Paenibacillus mesophilus]TMV45401.1 extracellular solute-binding protein [Paenibacillus mesophilus]